MLERRLLRGPAVAALIWLTGCASTPSSNLTCSLPPPTIYYAIRFPDPASHIAHIEAAFETGGNPTDVFMATWSPGFYHTQDYAAQVLTLSARDVYGAPVAVEHPKPNRWHLAAHAGAIAQVSYDLKCQDRFVTTNWVGEDYAILNGPATFIAADGWMSNPCSVSVDLPPGWKRSFSGMHSPSWTPNRFYAPNFDALADCPIVAGNFPVQEFTVDGHPHRVVNIGETGPWDTARAAADLEKIVKANRQFWGFLPYQSYTFLLAFRPGGGGLEHSSSTLATTSAIWMSRPEAYQSWLGFISHEYFRTFNVKRLRPVELGPFDYENPPRTASLWIAEGLTNYYGELMVTRARLAGRGVFLGHLSSHIHAVQTSPGRLVQNLEQASLDVWTSSRSGIGGDATNTVNYYEKGPVVGFLLDAKIRRQTDGRKSLDDVMRLAYHSYSGAHGYTPDQFREAAEEIAGVGLAAYFASALRSTDELDYTEALDWFGLRFEPAGDADQGPSWRLQVPEDATPKQRDRLASWLAGI